MSPECCNSSVVTIHGAYIVSFSVESIIIIIIIVNIIIIFTLMQGIYNYTPETSHVSRVYRVAGALYLQFMLHVMLFCPCNMFGTFTLALSIVYVQGPILMFFVVP